jgi:lycopene beta-cyclase
VTPPFFLKHHQLNSLHERNDIAYDYLFCGAGASACLAIINLESQGILDNKRVLIIDKEAKNRRDKTFCFWSFCNEPIAENLDFMISHSWSSVILPGRHKSDLHPLRYNHISSLDLYRHVEEIGKQKGWNRIIGEVTEVGTFEDKPFAVLNGQRISSHILFDSRTPHYEIIRNGETHLHQSFVGWRVSLHDSGLNPDTFYFMDFDVSQSNYTQFVYVLPYADGSALVELTRFGSEVIATSDAEKLLDEYITKKFGGYTIIDSEFGCIPMSNASTHESKEESIIQLVARNYSIKSSTGYAFKRMFYHGQHIAKLLGEKKPATSLNRNHSKAFSGRYAFYDGLLLDILDKTPQYGKPIFESLFKHSDIQLILSFLDEKTTVQEELKIFRRLPKWPFLRSLGRKLAQSSLGRSLCLTLTCLVVCLLPYQNSNIQTVLNLLLIAGLIAVGIPHGAVDHLLDAGHWQRSRLPRFIMQYIATGALMAGVWYVFPTTALVLFLVYSAWHFGQADGALWRAGKFESFGWGASLLLFILTTHVPETNPILEAMGTISLPFELPWWSLLPWTIWFAYHRNASATLTTVWLMLSSTIPLLFAFGLYFIGQHSLTGWMHIKSHLRMSSKSIWLQALPFHAGAWILLSFFIYAFPFHSNDALSNTGIVFIFLACISLPHVIAMQEVYRKNS